MNALHTLAPLSTRPASLGSPTWQAIEARRDVLLTDGRRARSRLAAHHWDGVLFDPVRELLCRPGKAFRARLVELGYALVKPKATAPDAACDLVELLHAGSLIIDDIEDGSHERRGGPAIHRMFGVPRALNAGNWLYFAALDQIEALALDAPQTLALYRRVNQTLLDCHRGQALDLGLRLGEVAQADIPALVLETSLLKTAALMALAPAVGAIAAGASPAQTEALTRFGRDLGLALQQLDDLGNLSARTPTQKRHEDLRNRRLTWPWAWAAESLPSAAFAHLELAARALGDEHPGAASRGTAIARRLVELAGPHRPRFIVNGLQRALDALGETFDEPDTLAALSAEILRLGESYV